MSGGAVRTAPPGVVRATLGTREPVLDEILRYSLLTRRLPAIQVDDNAARLLQLLTALQRPRLAIEIGTLFGWSTIHLARGLPPGGRLVTLEIDPAAAAVAERNLTAAGVRDRVDIVVGDAADHLRALAPESAGLIFIDADKRSYLDYLKLAFPLLEPGGLLIADDAFGDGDYSAENGGTDDASEKSAIRAYTRAVGRSPRLLSAFIGTESGLLISRKE
jgi:caffeoyl-CoA O-methyltransferase